MPNELIFEINLFTFPWSSSKAALQPITAMCVASLQAYRCQQLLT